MKRSFLVRIIPLLSLAFFGFALWHVTHQRERAQAEPLLPVPASPFTATVAGIGVVEPRSEFIDIGAAEPGLVTDVYVRPGEMFAAGDPLLTIDDRQAKARLAEAEANLKAARVAREDAAAKLAIIQSVQDKRAVSKDDVTQRRFALLRAEAAVAEAEAVREAAATSLERLTVTAPIDGVVLRRNIHPGEYATVGPTGEPLLVVGDTTLWHVRVEVDESQIPRVDPLAPAVARMRGAPEKSVDLDFVRFEPQVTGKTFISDAPGERVDTRVLEIIYSFPPEELSVFPGQQMDVFIQAEPLPLGQTPSENGS